MLQFLIIPLLPHRIPLAVLPLLATLPLDDLLDCAATDDALQQSLRQLPLAPSIDLLANLSALASRRVSSLASSSALRGYLAVFQRLLDKIPVDLLQAPDLAVPHSLPAPQIVDVSDDDEDDDGVVLERVAVDLDGDSAMQGSTPLPLDSRTRTFLAQLYSREHLVAVLALSNRHAADSRPRLAAFLVALLAAFPLQRDAILNTVLFGVGERGGGLLREVWRSQVRSGALARALESRAGALAPVLASADPHMDWPALILLTELYGRALLTLGDDEFYSLRNPLTLDEVVGLAGLLRNLAFGLYWQEGSVGAGVGWTSMLVSGTRLTVIELRTLAVGVLNQIHARE